VGFGKNQPGDSAGQIPFMEIDHPSKGDFEQLFRNFCQQRKHDLFHSETEETEVSERITPLSQLSASRNLWATAFSNVNSRIKCPFSEVK
jgi:hypothetical protein